MYDEMGCVLDQLYASGEEQAGQEEHERSGDQTTHGASIPVNPTEVQLP